MLKLFLFSCLDLQKSLVIYISFLLFYFVSICLIIIVILPIIRFQSFQIYSLLQSQTGKSTNHAKKPLLEERVAREWRVEREKWVEGEVVSLPWHFPRPPQGFWALSLQRLQFSSEGKNWFNSFTFLWLCL